jgi:acyl carrier protein
MGLEVVEIVLKIEKRFEISIPDESAALISTVGDLQRFILGTLARNERKDFAPDQVLEIITEILVQDFHVKLERINPEARIVADLGLD